MRRVVLLTLCACNQVFGIGETQLRDAPPASDASGPDAPFVCNGDSAPRFTGSPVIWSERGCFGYSIGGGLGAADCYDSDAFELGPVDGALAPGPGLPSRSEFHWPRISPEGDELFLHRKGNPAEIRVYRLVATTWTQVATIPPPSSGVVEASTPSRGPDRRVLLQDGGKTYEYSNTGGGWVDLQRTYLLDDFGAGLTTIEALDLSPDGRHFVFYGRTATDYGAFHASRASLADRFGPAAMIDGVPRPPYGDPFMSEDCGRIYYASDYTMFYMNQLP